MIDAMHREVTVRENGQPKRGKPSLLYTISLWAKALKGDHRATKMAIEMYHAAVNRNEGKRIELAEALFDLERSREEYYERKAKENSLRHN